MVAFTPAQERDAAIRRRIDTLRRQARAELREAFDPIRNSRRLRVERGRLIQRTRRRIVAVALLIAAVAAVLALT
jgi:hypothetical protein